VKTAVSMCRVCAAMCPIEVTVDDDGRAVRVVGDRKSDSFGGYSCAKGRAIPDLLNRPDRLLRSQKRQPDGSYAPIDVDTAIDEIAARLRAIVETHGPKAVAMFLGTRTLEHASSASVPTTFMLALDSPMIFSPMTIDQPGEVIAAAIHGTWLGGECRLEDSDAWLLIGTNPIVSHQYFGNNPLGRIQTATCNGCRLVVVDPRRTETARHAALHLQPRPGHDTAVLAAIVHLLFEWRAIDEKFVADNAHGVERLRATVAPFTADHVAHRADVRVDDLVAAARILAEAKRGGVYVGTGTTMSNMGGNLAHYLALAINTLRGWWAGEGDEYLRPSVILPEVHPKAQPRDPYPHKDLGDPLRVRNFRPSVCGPPTAALHEEILMPGEGQIRALFNYGGNPLMAIPETGLAHRALAALDLYVTCDVTLSNNARMADYVIAVKTSIEIPNISLMGESLAYTLRGAGNEGPYAQYAPAAARPPADSQLISEWQLYFRLAQRLGLQLSVLKVAGRQGALDAPPVMVPLDMDHEPTDDELLRMLCAGGRITFEELRGHEHGHLVESLRAFVGPRDPDCDEHLEIGAPEMMEELAGVFRQAHAEDPEFPFLLVSRRSKNTVNGTGQRVARLVGDEPYNPVRLHPADIAALGVQPEDAVELRSRHGCIEGVVAADDTLRPGVVTMAHGFGRHPDDPPDPAGWGANVNDLLSVSAEYDAISGMPRMSAVPIAIRARQPG
jgi:anaerobic selenocysteine-containing dehydrogenase